MMQHTWHRDIEIEGIHTHYLEAGTGPHMVLLHSGEFGADAELSWEYMISALAEKYHVLAPDWLGYGKTDKIHDFGGGSARRMRHLTKFLEALGVESAVFVGNSMGATALARMAASDVPPWPIEAAVLISGGGFVPHNQHRQALLDYDGTPEAMRAIMRVIMEDPGWALEPAYIDRRVAKANSSGAWECVAASRFKPPFLSPLSAYGRPDTTPYELISIPTLIIAGAQDKLRESGYATELAARIPLSRLAVYEECGHVPNLEMPDRVVGDIIGFLEAYDRGHFVDNEGAALPAKGS